jgi:hypothetical protein
MPQDDDKDGIWLEVAEVRWEGGGKKGCSVLLKADREQPKPVWWPVEGTALGKSGNDALFETYKAILNEMDKKRLVLARLSCERNETHHLRCDVLRFQSPDLGNR